MSVDGVVTKSSHLANSCLGVRRGLGEDLLGLFSMLLVFFFSVELGIHVRIRVGPEIWRKRKTHQMDDYVSFKTIKIHKQHQKKTVFIIFMQTTKVQISLNICIV